MSEDKENAPRLLTINTAAHYVGISISLMERYIQEGAVKTKRLQRDGEPPLILIERSELDRLADSGSQQGGKQS
jgi:hypothetical protein